MSEDFKGEFLRQHPEIQEHAEGRRNPDAYIARILSESVEWRNFIRENLPNFSENLFDNIEKGGGDGPIEDLAGDRDAIGFQDGE
jgi:hypothetical protein